MYASMYQVEMCVSYHAKKIWSSHWRPLSGNGFKNRAECSGFEFEVWEIYLSLLFSSSCPKSGDVFSYSVGKYTSLVLFLCCVYIYKKGKRKCASWRPWSQNHMDSVCFVCCAFTLPPFRRWLRCMEEFLAAGKWSVGYKKHNRKVEKKNRNKKRLWQTSFWFLLSCSLICAVL